MANRRLNIDQIPVRQPPQVVQLIDIPRDNTEMKQDNIPTFEEVTNINNTEMKDDNTEIDNTEIDNTEIDNTEIDNTEIDNTEMKDDDYRLDNMEQMNILRLMLRNQLDLTPEQLRILLFN